MVAIDVKNGREGLNDRLCGIFSSKM